METRASYLLVGAFVLALAAGALGFLVWLVKAGDGAGRIRYDMVSTQSVTGLRVGSPVRLNGVNVGEVVNIALNPDDPAQVQIGLEIGENVPVRTDTRASLELEGLTGGRYVLLSGGTAEAPPLRAEPGQAHPVIEMRPSTFEQLLQDAPSVLANINQLLDRASRLLSDENLENASRSMADLATFTQALAANSARLEDIIDNVDSALANLSQVGTAVQDLGNRLQQDAGRLIDKADETFGKIGQLADTLNNAFGGNTGRDIRIMMDKLMAGADAFTTMSNEIAQLVEENREPLREFSARGLFELINFLAEARELVTGLRKVTTDVERDPARFFFGNQQEGYEPTRR